MRGRGILLSGVGITVAAAAIGCCLVLSRAEPADPGLGPVVQVSLRPMDVAPSQRPSPVADASTAPAPTQARTTTAPTTRTAPPKVRPTSGAQSVPRHSPLPAGDDDDDDDDDDGDDDDD